MVTDNIVADAYWLRVIFADDIADDITFGYLTFRSLFYSFWCRFRTWWSFRRTSIIRRIRCGLVCFSFNLHVTGFSSCRITTMIHSYLVCVTMPKWAVFQSPVAGRLLSSGGWPEDRKIEALFQSAACISKFSIENWNLAIGTYSENGRAC